VTYTELSQKIDVNIARENIKRIQDNRAILKSIIKCLIQCGKQGIVLQGQIDDETCRSFNKGNFNVLLEMRVDAGDKILETI